MYEGQYEHQERQRGTARCDNCIWFRDVKPRGTGYSNAGYPAINGECMKPGSGYSDRFNLHHACAAIDYRETSFADTEHRIEHYERTTNKKWVPGVFRDKERDHSQWHTVYPRGEATTEWPLDREAYEVEEDEEDDPGHGPTFVFVDFPLDGDPLLLDVGERMRKTKVMLGVKVTDITTGQRDALEAAAGALYEYAGWERGTYTTNQNYDTTHIIFYRLK